MEAYKVLQYVGAVTEVDGAMFSPKFSVFISNAKWKTISPKDQAAIMKISGEALARRAAASTSTTRPSRKAYLAHGGIIVKATPAFNAELKKAWQPLYDKWIADANKEGVDGKAALDYIMSEAKKVATANRSITPRQTGSSRAREDGGSGSTSRSRLIMAMFLFVMMALTAADVIGRYVLNAPISGGLRDRAVPDGAGGVRRAAGDDGQPTAICRSRSFTDARAGRRPRPPHLRPSGLGAGAAVIAWRMAEPSQSSQLAAGSGYLQLPLAPIAAAMAALAASPSSSFW